MAAAPAGRATRIERRVAPEADATRQLYERYSGQVFGYCLSRLGNREEAEDAAQSTFLNAFRGLVRGVVPQSDSAWLFKIAENVCHSRHRSSWRRGRVESPSDLDAFQDVLPAPPRAQDESVNPDAFSFRSGATTVVDAGSAGSQDFADFRDNIIKKIRRVSPWWTEPETAKR